MAGIAPAQGPMKMRIRAMMNASKNNPKAQQGRANMQLLTQTGGITPTPPQPQLPVPPGTTQTDADMLVHRAGMTLMEKHAQIQRFIDALLFG